ncbi:MAG: 1-(5-phosphoribosyl)-5-[(5-phosphoribosylamino)methylideneamino]imidazole-4-carboxamide isomerase [Planctomycetia bacterium]
MLLLPAIDLRNGNCVRLKQGDYAQETVYSSNPADIANHWQNLGAKFLHLVDLDGAKSGKIENGEAIRKITSTLKIPCELGGGIRSEESINQALSWGISRVIIGTKALQDPDWLHKICQKYPQKIALGLDAKDGLIATSGWLEVSTISIEDFATRIKDWPLAAIIYTDISKDGMLAGPNITTTAKLAKLVKCMVIASGGVSSLDDIRNLKKAGIEAAIIGKALYDNKLHLPDALALS